MKRSVIAMEELELPIGWLGPLPGPKDSQAITKKAA